jgi:hypothetical protein
MPYIIALILIVVLGIGFTLFQQNKTTTPEPTAQEITTPATDAIPGSVADYKDGQHKTQVTYQTPKRDVYLMDVSLTVVNDIVTDAEIAYSQGAEKDPNAQKFDAAYRVEVIGKDIDSINLSRVGGASLTTGAFNNALANIKADAKS